MKVSALSFGASSLGGVFRTIKETEAIESVFTAVDCGINFIDVSPYYGHYKAETVLGKALKDIPRDKYFLSTKVGRYGKDGVNTWDYSAKRASESVQFAVSSPRIATTLFSSANPDNVRKNVANAEAPVDWDLVREVQDIIGDQMGVRWNNS